MSENEGERSRSENAEPAAADSDENAGIVKIGSKSAGTNKSANTSASKNANENASYPLIQHVQMPGKSGMKATNNPASSPHPTEKDEKAAPKPDPTRYGDWEKNGRCIDF